MLRQRSDPDAAERFRKVALRWRYATILIAVIFLVFLAFLAVDRSESNDLLLPVCAVILGAGAALVRPSQTLRLPIVAKHPFLESVGLGALIVSIVLGVIIARSGGVAYFAGVALPVLSLSATFQERYRRMALAERAASARRLSVTIPIRDETGTRSRQSDVELDIETNAGIAGVLDRVRGLLKLTWVDVREDGLRAVSPPVFKIQDLPRLFVSLRREGVEVEVGEDLTMDSADGAVIHARG